MSPFPIEQTINYNYINKFLEIFLLPGYNYNL